MTVPVSSGVTAGQDISFSLIHGGPLYSLRRKIGLVPEKGLGLGLRATVAVALTWLPITIAAIVEGRAFEGQDPLMRHFGLHARLLISLPLLIFAESLVEQAVAAIIRQFAVSELITDEMMPRFRDILQRVERVRDSRWGTVFVLAAVVGVVYLSFSVLALDATNWARDPELSFSGWWFLYVVQPIFVAYYAIWIWRLFVGWLLTYQISRLELQLVPSHPDGVGGLGFLEHISFATWPLVLAVSVVIAGHWAHEALYHGIRVETFQPVLVLFVVLVLLVFLGPLFMFTRTLLWFKMSSLSQYSALVGHQGRLVHQKWILRKDVGDASILDSPEIGPVADAITIYDSVARLRFTPIGKRSIIPLVLGALIPMLPVVFIQIPMKEMIRKLAGAIF